MSDGTDSAGRGPRVRRAAGRGDCRSAGELLDRFNREFDCETPGPTFLAERVAELIGGNTAVILARDEETEVSPPGGDDGIAVIRFRPALWSTGFEAYLAELYVVPESRRRGLGAELMAAVLEACRERGCDTVDLGTDEGDHDAHRLYERFGFSNLADRGAPAAERERMFVFERDL